MSECPIVVAASLAIDPSQRAELLAMIAAVGAATRAEPGCIEYRISCDVDAPNVFRVFEEWASAAELEAHLRTAHAAEFFASLARMRVLHASIVRYAVAARRTVL